MTLVPETTVRGLRARARRRYDSSHKLHVWLEGVQLTAESLRVLNPGRSDDDLARQVLVQLGWRLERRQEWRHPGGGRIKVETLIKNPLVLGLMLGVERSEQ